MLRDQVCLQSEVRFPRDETLDLHVLLEREALHLVCTHVGCARIDVLKVRR